MILSWALPAACSAPATGPSLVPALRIENVGSVDIKHLTVLFPGESALATAARVEFGDVLAGKTSDYQPVPGGVYRYAAYEYSGATGVVQQPVIDWVGETPMQGRRFTYRLQLDPAQPPGGQIQLVAALVDP